ncbi:hypothetical protein D8M04_04295 [Oceanobacillus piezotolerans]|uniref:Uncharacterized protein n=1 Tax=Oceanobacillus piezotolerans TaxID=2448030 RepID=A0A498DG12_9BACI|nr:hypothetical protein [Oceanobacillus piezotolerans]RLL48485.1 hypothetical protein D8M04_04295 [Oceanobacillus piezotolerans]
MTDGGTLVNTVLMRKIISASVSGTLFAILLGLTVPNPWGDISSITDYFFAFSIATPAYLMYSFPVILIYGVPTSIISDKIGEFLSGKTNNGKVEVIISGILHILFGLILHFYSLGVAILFFITDRLLQRNKKEYYWLHSIRSLAIPCTVWVSCMGIVYLENIFFN